MELAIDRDRYLMLVAALSAARCAGGPASQGPRHVVVPVDRGARESSAAGAEPFAGAAGAGGGAFDEASAEPGADGCRNDLGEVDCDWAKRLPTSACEGVLGSCELLPSIYQRRVAASVSACWEHLGKASCSPNPAERCLREAFHEVCADSRFVAPCTDLVERCRSAHKWPDFKVQECVEVLTAIADDGERAWAREAMSPAHESGMGGCKLMFPRY